MAKPTRLKYQGDVREIKDDKGHVIGLEPDRFVSGVPARDLDETDLADLSSDEIKHLTSGDDPLYVDPDAEKEKKAAAKKAKARKAATKKAPPNVGEQAPFEGNVGPEVVFTDTGDHATDGTSADEVESWPR